MSDDRAGGARMSDSYWERDGCRVTFRASMDTDAVIVHASLQRSDGTIIHASALVPSHEVKTKHPGWLIEVANRAVDELQHQAVEAFIQGREQSGEPVGLRSRGGGA